MTYKISNNLRSIYSIRLIFEIFHILDHIYKIYEIKLNPSHWFDGVAVFMCNASLPRTLILRLVVKGHKKYIHG